MMRKACLILAAACLAAGITACGNSGTQNTTTAAAEQTEASRDTSEEAENTKETETESSAEEETSEEASEKTVTGRVEGIDGTVLSISGQNDIAYQIDIADAEAGGSLEVGEGDQIQIVFTDSGQEVKTAISYDILTSAELEGDMDPILSGVVADATMNTIAVEAESGNTYHFSTAIAQMVTGENGIVIGEYVDVTYLGELPAAEEEGLALRVITEEASGDAEATYKTLSGSLVSLDEETLVLETEDGRQFSFAAAGAADPEEYTEGESITVTYRGSLTNENAELEEVESEE